MFVRISLPNRNNKNKTPCVTPGLFLNMDEASRAERTDVEDKGTAVESWKSNKESYHTKQNTVSLHLSPKQFDKMTQNKFLQVSS